MGEWRTQRLGEIAKLNMGQSPPGYLVEDLDSGLPFLQGNAEFGVWCPKATFQCDAAPRRSAPGDSLISVRAPVGAVNRSDRAYGIGRGLAAVTFKTVNPNFGHHAIMKKSRNLQRVSQGTTFTAVGQNELASLQFNIPPLEEQRRIAEILDTVDEAIRATERVISKSNLVLKGLQQELIGQHSEVDKGWRQISVGELGSVVTGGTPPTADEHCWDGHIPFITPGDVDAWGDVATTDRHVTQRGAMHAKRVPSGSVAVVCIGSIGKIGRIRETSVTNQQINTIIPSSLFDSEFVASVLELARPDLVAAAGRQVVPIVNASVLRSLPVNVCTLSLQQEISDRLVAGRARILNERVVLQKLQKLRSGLADDLLSGRVRTVSV